MYGSLFLPPNKYKKGNCDFLPPNTDFFISRLYRRVYISQFSFFCFFSELWDIISQLCYKLRTVVYKFATARNKVRIECNGGSATSGSSRQSSDNHVITVSEDEVRRALKRVNVRKAAGPDGITGHVLRSCADQLAGLFTSIFNDPLLPLWFPPPLKNLCKAAIHWI